MIALKFKKIKTLPCGHWSSTSSSAEGDPDFKHMKSPEKVLEYLSGFAEILPDIEHFIGDDSIIADFANTLIQEDIFFISTDRMQKIPKHRNNNQQIWLKDLNRYITNKINVDIDEMSNDISSIYEKYNTIVRNNQLTLINELQSNVESLDQKPLSETGNAEETYQQYQESIKSFEKIGITLETTIKTPNFDSPYIAITTKLLEIFNTSYQENFEDKIKYFIAFFDFIRKAIPTKNFSFKNNRIFISPRLNPELEIQPENLSSGEQQLVILALWDLPWSTTTCSVFR